MKDIWDAFRIMKRKWIYSAMRRSRKQLNIDNRIVRKLIQPRWQRDSECTERGNNFDQCCQYILNQSLVTPVSIANDPNLKIIYSNYSL